MKVLVTAILLGTVSMIIVFAAGLTSGVVRFSTLMFRAVWALSMTSAATFFLMMLFDFIEEKRMEKLKKNSPETLQEEVPVENSEVQPQAADGFQPMDATRLSNVEK